MGETLDIGACLKQAEDGMQKLERYVTRAMTVVLYQGSKRNRENAKAFKKAKTKA